MFNKRIIIYLIIIMFSFMNKTMSDNTKNFFDFTQKSLIKNLVLKLSEPSTTKSYFLIIFLKLFLFNLIL